MNRWTGFLLVMTVVSSAAVGCGDDDKDSGGDSDKCEQAAKILTDCDQEVEELQSCGAAEQKIADCVIQHPKGACSEELDDKDTQDFFACVSK